MSTAPLDAGERWRSVERQYAEMAKLPAGEHLGEFVRWLPALERAPAVKGLFPRVGMGTLWLSPLADYPACFEHNAVTLRPLATGEIAVGYLVRDASSPRRGEPLRAATSFSCLLGATLERIEPLLERLHAWRRAGLAPPPPPWGDVPT
jgi:hypothetical protein